MMFNSLLSFLLPALWIIQSVAFPLAEPQSDESSDLVIVKPDSHDTTIHHNSTDGMITDSSPRADFTFDKRLMAPPAPPKPCMPASQPSCKTYDKASWATTDNCKGLKAMLEDSRSRPSASNFRCLLLAK